MNQYTTICPYTGRTESIIADSWEVAVKHSGLADACILEQNTDDAGSVTALLHNGLCPFGITGPTAEAALHAAAVYLTKSGNRRGVA